MPPATRRGPLQRAAAGLLAAAAAFFKYGLVLLKFGKFGPMVISMLVSVAILGRLFGWTYGAGLVALILVHEMGHVIAARIERVPASLPFFLGPFGALISLKAPLKDARQDAVIAIGGPLSGTAGALVLAVAATQTSGRTHDLLMALAYFGFFLNLFNLTPMQPFDGGRVAGAVSIWLNVAGVAIMGGLVALTVVAGVGVNPFVVLIFVLGCFTTWQRFKVRRTNPYTRVVPPRTRAFIATAWVGLIAVCALGMSISHRSLVDAGAIDRPSTNSSASQGAVSLDQVSNDLGVVVADARQVVSSCDSDVQSPACASAASLAASDQAGIAAEVRNSPAPAPLADAAAQLGDNLVGLQGQLAARQFATAAATVQAIDASSADVAAGVSALTR
jgi:Zn-dependent protease